VALPDGRIQIVSYIADADGFKATVSYEGEAVYPNPGDFVPYSPPQAHPVPAVVVPGKILCDVAEPELVESQLIKWTKSNE